MKVLVVGGGGREHAVIRKLKESAWKPEIICAPGNGGISADAECVEIKATDIAGMVDYALSHKVDYVVVTPDDPLALGMVDALKEAGIPAFGPTKAAARIEASKVFSKNLMEKYGIPTAKYEVFESAREAAAYVRKENTYPTVIKADGLALGKGVLIAQDEAEAMEAIRTLMVDKAFGESGTRVVIEEFLTGIEVSVLSFADGETVIPMVSSMDHKRALDGDEGLNTGGMGTIAPNPYYTADIAEKCMKTIFLPTIDAMNAEGRTFKGCLYFGLMLTKNGPKVIEYNCRFGDPETQVVLPLLESDLLEIMMATTSGNLDKCEVKFANSHACCVIMASKGYPEKYESGYEITISPEVSDSVYVAGARLDGDKLVNAGGRVLGVSAIGDSLNEAIDLAYEKCKKISFANAYYRSDIGARAKKALRGDK